MIISFTRCMLPFNCYLDNLLSTVMFKSFYYCLAFICIVNYSIAQSREVGPYTVTELAPGVTRIEDANKSNPSGIHTDAAGKTKVSGVVPMK